MIHFPHQTYIIMLRRIICGLAVLSILSGALSGQTNPIQQPVLSSATDFGVIQAEMNAFYAAHPTAPGYKQWKRKEWFLAPRLYPSNQMENLTLKTWKAYDRYMKSQPSDRATHGSWSFLGPTSHPIGLGRLNAIAFHNTDPDIMYAGSANGGVWKTINGGTSWSNVTPNIPLLAIADVQVSPTNSNVIYILTGDGDPLPGETSIHSQSEVSSIGILRSSDGGSTWYPTNFSFDHPSTIIPTRLIIHPTNVNIQMVVHKTGIVRTTDHWANWTTVLNATIFDIEYKPGDPDIVYAGGDNDIRRSVDGGATWSTITDADFSNMSGASRVELAVTPDDPDVVYALAGNWSGFSAFFESQSSGANNTWTLRNNTATTLGAFTTYCVALAVDPADWTDVFGGMQWINRSLNQGTNWTSIVQNTVHADIHDVAYRNGALWVCHDGGLDKSTNEGNSWSTITNGMAITEIYRIAGTPNNTNLYFAGCQDNGTMRRNGATSAFEAAFGNDGMTPMIDYNNSNNVYISWQNGNFEKSTTGGGNGSFSPLTIPGGNGAWITPAIMDPGNSNRIFVGKASLYRSDDGGSNWQNLGNPGGGGAFMNCLAQGTSNTNRLYATKGTAMYRTDNALVGSGNATWNTITAGLPNLAISGVAVDPANSLRVFVVLSGYSDGNKVFRSTNGGDTWVNISGSLPNVPVNCIAFHDVGGDAIYVGTDIGVFFRNNSLGDWIYYSNFLPAVTVNDLYINTSDNTIVAGTYGRGLWRSSTYDGCDANVVLFSLFGVAQGGQRFYSATNSITNSAIYKKDIGTEIHLKAGNYIDLTTGFEAGTLGFLEATLGPCPDIFSEPMLAPQISRSRLVMDGFVMWKNDD